MNLIIVESPTKAKTLGKFLGSGYDVEATMGHIKDLPKSTLGVDIEHNFKPDYVDVVKRKDTIALLKKKAKSATQIFLASDPDREGEAISAHVKEILGTTKKIERISFHEITKEAVEEAIAHPRPIDTNLVDAQTARRVLDRLVGYKLSPLLWKKVRVGLSAGRVQSVAVRLIVEKEREIEKFKAEEYWEIYVIVKSEKVKGKGEFTVQLIKQEVKNKKSADEIIADLEKAEYKVGDVKKRQVTKNPYAPFTTSTMTQAAARVMGWSSKKTMSVAQGLYEEGLITYHRTDSLNLSAQAIEKARGYILKNLGKEYLPVAPRIYKTTSKVAQEAHEAIRPTDVTAKFETSNVKFADEAERLYDLIWRRFIACQMTSSVYDETTIDVLAGSYLLRASGQIMKFDGWRKIMPIANRPQTTAVDGSQSTEDIAIILPEVVKDEKLSKEKVWGDQKFTQPPARFNEASLIKTLEKLGIGRPSTYAPTISVIQIRSYVEKNDSKQFVPTTVGIAVNDFLMTNFPDTFDYSFTAGMEDRLDEVANGKLKWENEIAAFWKPFDKKLIDVEKNAKRVKIEVEKLGIKCPDCKDGELVIRTGRFGKFISCSLFPECKHTEKYLEKVGVKCPDCKEGDVIVKKTGKGRKFFGCSRYPDCKFASWQSPKKEEILPPQN
ncbi:MAG TPA: type I DNA topoisomerase [Patescibacteria group bacterium]|nr:type I DNA topoisomerase [Patescibacteria group bacterium]